MVVALAYVAVVILYYYIKYGGLNVDCHVALLIVSVFHVSQFSHDGTFEIILYHNF